MLYIPGTCFRCSKRGIMWPNFKKKFGSYPILIRCLSSSAFIGKSFDPLKTIPSIAYNTDHSFSTMLLILKTLKWLSDSWGGGKSEFLGHKSLHVYCFFSFLSFGGWGKGEEAWEHMISILLSNELMTYVLIKEYSSFVIRCLLTRYQVLNSMARWLLSLKSHNTEWCLRQYSC